MRESAISKDKEKEDLRRSESSASQMFEVYCGILIKILIQEALSRETCDPSDSKQTPPLKPRQSALIRLNLLWLQRGLDQALRTGGKDMMSREDDIFIETTITNENRDVAIAMSSSRADPVLGRNIPSSCPGWGYLNI